MLIRLFLSLTLCSTLSATEEWGTLEPSPKPRFPFRDTQTGKFTERRPSPLKIPKEPGRDPSDFLTPRRSWTDPPFEIG